jgi:hypothetical protein
MNTFRTLVATALLTGSLAACSTQQQGGSTEITEPGPAVTQPPSAPEHRDQPCRADRCPR